MFETIRTVLSLLPVVIQAVKSLEDLFPESGKGAMKFELIVDVLKETHEVSNEVLPLVEKIINVVVDVFNRFGVFTKSE